MIQLLTLFSLALSLVNGLLIPDIEAATGPTPFKLDFSVSKTVGNSTAREFWARNKRDAFAETITDYRDLSYLIDIYLGSEKIKNSVVIDTGSSDLWVPQDGYDPKTSTTSKDTGIPLNIGYLDGTKAQGEFYQDTLKFETGYPVLSDFVFAHSTATDGGILGIGDKDNEAPYQLLGFQYDNLPYALYKAGITSKVSYSLFLGPDLDKGSLIFGGFDTEKYTGDLVKYNIDKRGGGLAVDAQSIGINGKELATSGPFLLDSGTSLGLLKRADLDALVAEFGGYAVFQGRIELRIVSCNQPSDKFIDFNFGQNTISIPYSEAITKSGDGRCLLGFGWLDDEQILGDVFLRQAYVYYDLTEQTISLAKASYSTKSNIVNA